MALKLKTREVHEAKRKRLVAAGILANNEKLTFKYVGEKAGLDQRTVSSAYTGDIKYIPTETLEKLWRFYECPIEDLFVVEPD